MQMTVDTHDRFTLYADLRDDEALTDDLRVRAITRARQLGALHVEFWRPPYGCGGDCMQGFVEHARVPVESEAASGAVNARADEAVKESSNEQFSRAR